MILKVLGITKYRISSKLFLCFNIVPLDTMHFVQQCFKAFMLSWKSDSCRSAKKSSIDGLISSSIAANHCPTRKFFSFMEKCKDDGAKSSQNSSHSGGCGRKSLIIAIAMAKDNDGANQCLDKR